MEQITKEPLTLPKFLQELSTRCIALYPDKHTAVWFNLFRDGLVMIDSTIHADNFDVIISFRDRPKITIEQAYNIYLQLFNLQ